MNIKKYTNGRIYGTIFVTAVLIFLFTYIVLRVIIVNRCVGIYANEMDLMYKEWYQIVINEPHTILDFQKETVYDFSLNTIYKYSDISDRIFVKYDNVLKKHKWIFLGEKNNGYIYHKNNLQLILTEKENNIWKVRIEIKGYQDQGLLSKLFFWVEK